MLIRKLAITAGACLAFSLGQSAMAQEDLTCADIEWSSVVTDQYPNIANACDAVMQKNGKTYARVEVEVLRVRGNTLTFKILNNDGSSGGSYSQTVANDWRASIGGRSYRARDLNRGQQMNVYFPSDRWAVIHEDEDGPDAADAAELAPAAVLPATASPLFLIGGIGGGLLSLGAALSLVRRRQS